MIHYITTNGIGNAWVANELRIVQRSGIPFVLHTMRLPRQNYFLSEWAAELNRRSRPIYPLPIIGLVLSVLLAPILFRAAFFGALANALFARRESLRARVAALAHLFVACHWARGLRGERVSLIHSQWVHSCGTIGMYGAWLLGKPFSFTGHAADLFRDRVALVDKIRRADRIICISTFHRDFYRSLGARDEQLQIVYCGIDVSHFSPANRAWNAEGRWRIRASGRLVEKKGFCHLVEACQILNALGVNFDCIIAGGGPLQDSLQSQIDALNLSGRVRLTGSDIKQEEIPAFMHGGDVYCLPCVWAPDNDVDGLPQMLMEAMACGLPAISTRLVGIPDLVIDDETGLLVEPNDARQLAAAILRLRDDPDLANRLARAGRLRVLEKFDIDSSLEPLIDLFREHLDRSAPQERAKTAMPADVQLVTHESPS